MKRTSAASTIEHSAPVGRSAIWAEAFSEIVSVETSGESAKSPTQVTVTVKGSSPRSLAGSSPTIDLETVRVPTSRVLVKAAVAGEADVVVISTGVVATVQPSGSSVSSTVQRVPGGTSGSPSAEVQVPAPFTVVIVAVPDESVGSVHDHANVNVSSAMTPAGATVLFEMAKVDVALMISIEAPSSVTMAEVPSGYEARNWFDGASLTAQSAPVGTSARTAAEPTTSAASSNV